MKRMGCGSVVALGGVLGWGGGGAEVKGGGGKMPGGTTGNVMPGGVAVKPEAADAFTTAVNEFKRHDEARDWDDASCKKVSDEFLAAGSPQRREFPALPCAPRRPTLSSIPACPPRSTAMQPRT